MLLHCQRCYLRLTILMAIKISCIWIRTLYELLKKTFTKTLIKVNEGTFPNKEFPSLKSLINL